MSDYDSLTIEALRGEVIRLEQDNKRLRSDEWVKDAAKEITLRTFDSGDWNLELRIAADIIRKHRNAQ